MFFFSLIGNQAEHFLGSMSFAKSLNRTLVVPPFRTYKNVPYSDWFKLEEISKFHRSISAEDFMEHIAPDHWPLEERQGFCWGVESECNMNRGNPYGLFWKELGVDEFTRSVNFQLDYSEVEQWSRTFPPSQYPVIALKGAPASYPIKAEHRSNQMYMKWSDSMNEQVDDYIEKTFGKEKFIGIHLRNGIDWVNACVHLEDENNIKLFNHFMASPQCTDNTDIKLSKNLCYPSTDTVLNDLETVLHRKLNGTVKHIYIATDQHPLNREIKKRLGNSVDKLVHNDPWLPVMDLAILARSEYFIGNCVSSFTAFVKRERDLSRRLSSFWSIV